ncbi:bifunctional demethylmenaquinone methyltransferase/2-methoxy-6-polyprenyl-1,4-benzoquinol methylase UbiE [bacterium]|nr:bifunctional demethylmenaquinone methyltransferase/2-methoxy-6-polyprenyl-1,4-benzoquinol methylase UbiE [Pirellulales bacterium]MDA7937948.1 bifunctional demethylmenaquinone methyltransferase/2-methoxy-6-polyprenyl-1,4-benzoquinol methylase UbiE [Pirellulales bacterium]MDB4358363.1 bifunctional demethylmenaquinone methyltransferase/2-methoxy-6-polyprenyl-1,4-benzoquinol methylase UbiE [bacterium]MDC1301798.1 bifunctional demethylmenaquinone methyltransferase/2-methoxy-6-polyprenyl-1,4-benzoq
MTSQTVQSVDKSGGKVQEMFAEIAPRYDFVNRMLSGGIDIWWRRITVKRAPPPTTGAILDVCTGTGDLALAYAVKAGPSVRVVGSDFCKPMLDRGIEKSATRNVPVEWLEADAMELPFPDNSFDLVTVAFGLRNIAETDTGLSEMCRVCKPGGRLAILEFSLPENVIIRKSYLWYFRNVLPRIGNAIAQNHADAYSYLNQSVEEFPSGDSLVRLIKQTGFDHVDQFPLTFGVATLSIATKPNVPE